MVGSISWSILKSAGGQLRRTVMAATIAVCAFSEMVLAASLQGKPPLGHPSWVQAAARTRSLHFGLFDPVCNRQQN